LGAEGRNVGAANILTNWWRHILTRLSRSIGCINFVLESALLTNNCTLSAADFISTSEVCGAGNWGKCGLTCGGVRMNPVTSLLTVRGRFCVTSHHFDSSRCFQVV
jgi:hypothetical protein